LTRGAQRWLYFSKLSSGKKVVKKVKSRPFHGDPPTHPPNFGPSYFFTPWAKLKSKNGFGILSSSSTKLGDGVIYFEHCPPHGLVFYFGKEKYVILFFGRFLGV
jgi:hypothetical protein